MQDLVGIGRYPRRDDQAGPRAGSRCVAIGAARGRRAAARRRARRRRRRASRVEHRGRDRAATTSTTARDVHGASARRGSVQPDVRVPSTSRGRISSTFRRRTAGPPPCRWCSTSTATVRTRCSRWSTATSSRSRERNDFLIVAPDGQDTGSKRHFNLTGEKGLQNDIAMVMALLDHIEATFCVDTARVYSTGMSDGGAMTSVLACLAPNRFAAFGPVAVQIVPAELRGTHPVAMVAFHGTADPIVPYAAERCVLRRRRSSAAVPTTMANWAAHDHCDAKYTDTSLGTQVSAAHVDGLRRNERRRALLDHRRRPHLAGIDSDRGLRDDHHADQRERHDLGVLRSPSTARAATVAGRVRRRCSDLPCASGFTGTHSAAQRLDRLRTTRTC